MSKFKVGDAVWIGSSAVGVEDLAEVIDTSVVSRSTVYLCRIAGPGSVTLWRAEAHLRPADRARIEDFEREQVKKFISPTPWDEIQTRPVTVDLAPKKLEPKPCLVCPNEIKNPHPGSTFCSPMCAEAAAKALKPADRALRFLCGLNLQDHSVKEQRELLEIVHELKDALELARHRREAGERQEAKSSSRDIHMWLKPIR